MLLGFTFRLDPFAVLVLALVLDALLGDPPALWRRMMHPVAAMGKFVEWLDRRYCDNRLQPYQLRRRGKLAAFAIILLNAVLGWFVAWAFSQTSLAFILEAMVVALFLAGRDLYDHVAGVARALEADGLAGGRDAVRHIVGRDPETLDNHGVSRAAIETLAENFTDGVVAPALWYAFFGLPGLFPYKALNTADSMIGHTGERYHEFGRAVARLDDLANFVPARIAGMVFVGAAWLVRDCDPKAAFRVMKRDAPKHRSPNAGWTEAAVAGALGLALNGPRSYGGETKRDPWMGDGRAEATATDIRRALVLYLHTAGLFIVWMFVCAWLNR